MRTKLLTIGFLFASGVLLVACSTEADTAKTEPADTGVTGNSFVGDGPEVAAPEGFDPLGNGKVYEGSYSVTAVDSEGLEENYASTGGTAYFDLGDLKPLSADKTVNVYVHEAGASLIMPRKVPVKLECTSEGAENACSGDIYNKDASGNTLTMKITTIGGAIEIAELQPIGQS